MKSLEDDKVRRHVTSGVRKETDEPGPKNGRRVCISFRLSLKLINSRGAHARAYGTVPRQLATIRHPYPVHPEAIRKRELEPRPVPENTLHVAFFLFAI